MAVHGFPLIFIAFHGFPWISKDVHGFSWIFMDVPVAILAQVRNVWLEPLRGASGFCKPPREECQAVVRLVVRLVVVVLHGRLEGLFRLFRLRVVRLPVGPSGRAPVGSRAPLPIGLCG